MKCFIVASMVKLNLVKMIMQNLSKTTELCQTGRFGTGLVDI